MSGCHNISVTSIIFIIFAGSHCRDWTARGAQRGGPRKGQEDVQLLVNGMTINYLVTDRASFTVLQEYGLTLMKQKPCGARHSQAELTHRNKRRDAPSNFPLIATLCFGLRAE